MDKLNRIAKFLLSNFGPLIVFYVVNHYYGLKVAILASIIWTLVEITSGYIRKKPVTTFFKFCAGITIVFGIADMYLQQSIFFKYEAAATNVLTGLYFAFSLLSQKPLIQEFAEAQGRVIKAKSDGEYYLKFMTVIWSLYFFVKAVFYGWIASRYSIEEALAIRGVVGNATFYGLLFISMFCSKQIKFLLAKVRLLPSKT